MKLYSYVVRRDYGFAPNPFFDRCTLATCKHRIRKGARVGDWVVGTGSKAYNLGGRLVYAMKVGETLTFDAYWSDPRFALKRPNLRGSIKQAFGDNIYHRAPSDGRWCQAKSHHSHGNGQLNSANVETDTQVDRVLVSSWFVYFGRDAIEIPKQFRQGKGENVVCQGRNHLVNFDPGFAEDFVAWIRSLRQEGLRGEPMEFRDQLAKTGTGIQKQVRRSA